MSSSYTCVLTCIAWLLFRLARRTCLVNSASHSTWLKNIVRQKRVDVLCKTVVRTSDRQPVICLSINIDLRFSKIAQKWKVIFVCCVYSSGASTQMPGMMKDTQHLMS